MNPVLSAVDLEIGYDEAMVLRGLDFSIKSGEMICIMGSNGCGKTTLLRTLAALRGPRKGRIFLAGREITDYKPDQLAKMISVVLTSTPDLQNLTVEEVVALGRFPHTNFWGYLRARDRKIIKEALETLGMSWARDQQFGRLSDGQKQKVLIARCLAQDTPIILLDEPTTFLDISGKIEVLQLLKNIAQTRKIAVLFSSHDWDMVLGIVGKVWLINLHGQLIEGPPEDLILSGEFEKCFGNKNFYFSRSQGIFKTIAGQGTKIKLLVSADTEPNKKFWTAHALEKGGFEVITSSLLESEKIVPVITIHDRYWELKKGRDIYSFDSIGALLASL